MTQTQEQPQIKRNIIALLREKLGREPSIEEIKKANTTPNRYFANAVRDVIDAREAVKDQERYLRMAQKRLRDAEQIANDAWFGTEIGERSFPLQAHGLRRYAVTLSGDTELDIKYVELEELPNDDEGDQ